jgi:hypothetical protein
VTATRSFCRLARAAAGAVVVAVAATATLRVALRAQRRSLMPPQPVRVGVNPVPLAAALRRLALVSARDGAATARLRLARAADGAETARAVAKAAPDAGKAGNRKQLRVERSCGRTTFNC